MFGYGVLASTALAGYSDNLHSMTRQLILNVGLSDRACFDNFLAGVNAETMHSVEELVDFGAGLLVLYGEQGSGKTHLLYAAQKAALAANRRATYFSMSDEDVLSGLDRFEETEALVCVDDVDQAAGDDRSERFLFNLVEILRSTHSGMLLAAQKPPSECGFQLADLVSRLNSGVSFRMTPLSDEDKSAALRLRAEHRGFHLSEEVIAYVMNRFSRDASALFGLLDRIDRYSLSEQRKVTIPLIKALETD